jgi:hypothetical protein
MYHFCTYFDRNYLPRGLALHRSLVRHARPFVLHVLCLDEPTFSYLSGLRRPDLRPIALADFLAADPELAAAKSNRSLIEFYFTCTAPLALYVLDSDPGIDLVTYLDADLFFFSDPAPALGELGDRSVLIVGHRFPPRLKGLEKYGVYNVGLLSFRNDARGRGCLAWWRERCLAWCYDRWEGGKFADQKYLDDWPGRFPGVAVLQHKGANLAPWNVAAYKLRRRGGAVLVDADPLVCFHFHHLRVINRFIFELGLEIYGVPLCPVLKREVYYPYLRELQEVSAELAAGSAGGPRKRGAQNVFHKLHHLLFQSTVVVVAGPVLWENPVKLMVQPFLRLVGNGAGAGRAGAALAR